MPPIDRGIAAVLCLSIAVPTNKFIHIHFLPRIHQPIHLLQFQMALPLQYFLHRRLSISSSSSSTTGHAGVAILSGGAGVVIPRGAEGGARLGGVPTGAAGEGGVQVASVGGSAVGREMMMVVGAAAAAAARCCIPGWRRGRVASSS